jgi:hypothetical protein
VDQEHQAKVMLAAVPLLAVFMALVAVVEQGQ